MRHSRFSKLIILIFFYSYLACGDGNHAAPGVIIAGGNLANTTDGEPSDGNAINPNGGHRIVVTDFYQGNSIMGENNVISSPLLFKGGNGALTVNNITASHGGSGLFIESLIDEVNVNVTNAIFSGGSGGVNFNLEGNTFGSVGHGIEWDVHASNSSTLSLVGVTVSNGISISAESDSILNLSYTNTYVSGGIDKTGLGILFINNRDANSLEDLDIQNGSLIFSNNLIVGSTEQINLSNSSSSLIASNGLSLVGGISGSGTIEVYNDMEISGILNGILTVDLASVSNSLTLKSGYSINGAIFNADGTQDSLVFEENGTYNADDLGMNATFTDFESVQLSDLSDTWEGTNSFNYMIDGGASLDDIFAFSSSGTYSSDDFISITNNISGFESYGLSSGDDIWIAKSEDASLLEIISGRSGIDSISFAEYRPASSEIGVTYLDFEGALLESGSNTWHNTLDYSELDFIDGSEGVWELSYVSNNIGITASAVSNNISTGYYRNFNSVELTEYDDTWNTTVGENNLSFIDGGLGTNTLSGVLTSASGIGTTYINFNQVELDDLSNNWTVSPGDTNLISINALHSGVDYLSYGGDVQETNSLFMGENKLYRGFDQVNLNNGNDEWRATTNDVAILINVDAGSGDDLLSYIDYEEEVNIFSKSTHVDTRYFEFEEVELTTTDDIWLYADDDNNFVLIDAEDGEDELLVQDISSLVWSQSHSGRYSDFELLHLDNASLSFEDYDLGGISDITLEDNAIINLDNGSLNISGIYQQNSGSILSLNAQTNFNISARLSANQINFNSGASMQFSGDASSFAIGNRYTNYVASATSSISIGNSALFSNNPGAIDVKDWYLDSDRLYVIFDRRSLTDQTFGFDVENGSKFDQILTEIDSMQSQQASEMANLVFSGNIALADLENVYDRTIALPRAVSHQRNGILRAITERTNERRMMMTGLSSPLGPNGPKAEQKGLSIWGKGYTANGDASADNNIEGYDLSGVGTVFGVDYTMGKLVLGGAVGAFSQTMKMDSSGEYTGSGSHITGYASYGLDGWFLESGVSLANSSLDFSSASSFNFTADYVADDFTFYIGSGYIMRNETSSWTPEIGFIFNSYEQAETTDISQQIVPVSLESISKSNVKMRLGLTGGFKKDLIGRELLTQIKLRWMNTIGVMDEVTDFQLSGGENTYQTPLLTSAKSTVEFGVGTQLRMNRSFALLMGFDYELGGGYSANRLSAGLRYSF